MTSQECPEGWHDEDLWGWLDDMADEYDSTLERHRARVRQCKKELDRAGRRATPSSDAEDWVMVIDVTDNERGLPLNKPIWLPRAPWEAYHHARGDLSRFMNGEAVDARV